MKICLSLILGLTVFITAAAWAQEVRPGDSPLPRPGFESPDDTPTLEVPVEGPESVLPPLPLPIDETQAPFRGAQRVVVRQIEFTGNTVLAPATLHEIARSYEGRALDHADLESLRDAVTRAYVDAGFVTSGARIPPQSIQAGVLTVAIVEGRLSDIAVESSGRLRPSYARARIEGARNEVVNLVDLERRMTLLQQDARIRSVKGRLEPTDRLGQARLQIDIEEAPAFAGDVGAANANAWPIGEWRGEFRAAHLNVTGFGDRLLGEYRVSAGLQDVRGAWRVPLTGGDLAIEASIRRTWSEVVDGPAAPFDIESQTGSYGLTLSRPLWRGERFMLMGYASWEWRRSQSYLLGQGFAFVPGPNDAGAAVVSPLRFGAEWQWSTPRSAIAARSQISVGLPILNATENASGVPDGRYVSWLTQLEVAHRLPVLDLQIVTRGMVQLSNDPLLSLEQLALGGVRSVRGYPENIVVQDNGAQGSFELRWPFSLPRVGPLRPRAEIFPFVDAAYGWSQGRAFATQQTLASAGLGARVFPLPQALVEVQWGRPIAEDVSVTGSSLQSDGVHIRVGYAW